MFTPEERTYMLVRYGKYLLWAAMVLLLIIGAYACYSDRKTPPMQEVKEVKVDTVQDAMSKSGIKVSNEEAGKITDKIISRVSSGTADYTARVKSESEADKVAKDRAKDEKADSIIKEKKTNPQNPAEQDMYYYAIHMEKKNAIGVYTDLTKDGSYGVHIRRDKLVLQVGKKYEDGSIAARVAYELKQW